MLKRTITTVAIVLVIIPLCVFSATWAFPLAVSLFTFIATYEMLGCVGARKKVFIAVPAYGLSLSIPILCRLVEGETAFIALFATVMFFFLCFLYVVCIFSKGSLEADSVFSSFTTLVYIFAGFSSLILLADRPFGFYFLILTLFMPWISDVFAYLSGRLFGKHKLIPAISPKKTVEGMVGAIVFTVFFSIVYGSVVSYFVEDIRTVSYPAMALAGAVISIVAQIGDLIMSFIKRRYAIKDYGFLLPGHGGILDRFDSVLAVAPFMLFLTSFEEKLYFFS